MKCGVYCEGYLGSQGEKGKEGSIGLLGCIQVGTSFICDSCLKDLREALELCSSNGK